MSTLGDGGRGSRAPSGPGGGDRVVDVASRKGHFGWTTVDGVNLPYLLRDETQYVSVKIVEMKLLSKYPNEYPDELRERAPLMSQFATEVEVQLLNEINRDHCQYEYGRQLFGKQELLVRLSDLKAFYEIVKKHFPKASSGAQLNSGDSSSEVDGGWLQINNTVVPYITRASVRLLPVSVIKYAAGLLINVKVMGCEASDEERKFLSEICQEAGLTFSFNSSTKLMELDLLTDMCSNKVEVRDLPRKDPFGHAEFKEVNESPSQTPKLQPPPLPTVVSGKTIQSPPIPPGFPLPKGVPPPPSHPDMMFPNMRPPPANPMEAGFPPPWLAAHGMFQGAVPPNYLPPPGFPPYRPGVSPPTLPPGMDSNNPTRPFHPTLSLGKPPGPGLVNGKMTPPADKASHLSATPTSSIASRVIVHDASKIRTPEAIQWPLPAELTGLPAPANPTQSGVPATVTDRNANHQPSRLAPNKRAPVTKLRTSGSMVAPPIQPLMFQDKTISCIMRGGVKFVLVEAISRVFFPDASVEDFLFALRNVLRLEISRLDKAEEQSLINFYGLRTESLRCNLAIRFTDLEANMEQLQRMLTRPQDSNPKPPKQKQMANPGSPANANEESSPQAVEEPRRDSGFPEGDPIPNAVTQLALKSYLGQKRSIQGGGTTATSGPSSKMARRLDDAINRLKQNKLQGMAEAVDKPTGEPVASPNWQQNNNPVVEETTGSDDV